MSSNTWLITKLEVHRDHLTQLDRSLENDKQPMKSLQIFMYIHDVIIIPVVWFYEIVIIDEEYGISHCEIKSLFGYVIKP